MVRNGAKMGTGKIEMQKKSIEELEKDWKEFKSENIEEYQLEI